MRDGDATLSLERLLGEDSFVDVTVAGLDLQGVDLGGKEFTGCTFRSCKGQESRWRRARLDECRFESCDLTRMQVRGAVVLDLRFDGCKLMGVEWAELGHLPQLAFRECVLDYASFVGLPLRGVEFLTSQLIEATFLDSDLRAANFAGSELRGAIFRGCKLEKTDLSAAIGALFDPAVNEARGALISLETAALLAMEQGLVVAGFSAERGGRAAATTRAPARARRR